MKTLKHVQQQLNRAVARRTGFDNVAHVNQAWLYSEPPVELGVPQLLKEQAVVFLSTLAQMNEAHDSSWLPAWESFHEECASRHVCTQVALPIYKEQIPKRAQHTLAGHIIQAITELNVQ